MTPDDRAVDLAKRRILAAARLRRPGGHLDALRLLQAHVEATDPGTAVRVGEASPAVPDPAA